MGKGDHASRSKCLVHVLLLLVAINLVRPFFENEIILIQIIQHKRDVKLDLWCRIANKNDLLGPQYHFLCKVWSWKFIKRFRGDPFDAFSLYLLFTWGWGTACRATGAIKPLFLVWLILLTRFSRILTIWTSSKVDTGPETWTKDFRVNCFIHSVRPLRFIRE